MTWVRILCKCCSISEFLANLGMKNSNFDNKKSFKSCEIKILIKFNNNLNKKDWLLNPCSATN